MFVRIQAVRSGTAPTFSDAVVKVERNDHMTVKILGLDDHGYLLAEKPDGGRVSLQDDGNSFDMMANLIRIKAS